MKIAAVVLACAAGASAFAPAAKSFSSVATPLNSVFDDYVGGIDLRGQKFEFDPVRRLILLFRPRLFCHGYCCYM